MDAIDQRSRSEAPSASRLATPVSGATQVSANRGRRARLIPRRGSERRGRGFTLIELMITVAVVAILAAVALPIYRNYVIRGQLVAQTNALASFRALMEQFYQDNRQYTNVTTATPTILSPCNDPSVQKNYPTFTLSCASSRLTATTYLLQAQALSTALSAGAAYTVDNTNAMATTGFPTNWGSVPGYAGSCWLLRQAGGC